MALFPKEALTNQAEIDYSFEWVGCKVAVKINKYFRTLFKFIWTNHNSYAQTKSYIWHNIWWNSHMKPLSYLYQILRDFIVTDYPNLLMKLRDEYPELPRILYYLDELNIMIDKYEDHILYIERTPDVHHVSPENAGIISEILISFPHIYMVESGTDNIFIREMILHYLNLNGGKYHGFYVTDKYFWYKFSPPFKCDMETRKVILKFPANKSMYIVIFVL